MAAASPVRRSDRRRAGSPDHGGRRPWRESTAAVPQFNIVPKTGGNKLSGTGFASTAGKWSQGNNLDDTLRSYGITEVPGLIKNWDLSGSVGGPVVKDRLWFYGTVRNYGQHNDIPLLYANKNAGVASAWNYVPDKSVKARGATNKQIEELRFTGQVTPKNKVGVYYDYQKNCTGSALVQGGEQCRDRGSDWVALGSIGGFGSLSPESGNVWDDREKIFQSTWSSPMTSKLLLEAGLLLVQQPLGRPDPGRGADGRDRRDELLATPATQVPIGGFAYRGWASAATNDQQHNVWRASGTYVTGAHSLKVGYQAAFQVQSQTQIMDNALQYTFLGGVPISFTMRVAPWKQANRTRFDAIYAQDQWTHGKLTLQGALRYEHAWSWYPEGENGVIAPSQFLATPFTFPRSDGVTGLPRHHAAHGRRVRPVRQRQDVAARERQQVSRAGEQRQRVHDQEPGRDLPVHDRSQLDRREQQQGAGLRPDEPGPANGECCGLGQLELPELGADDPRRPRRAERLGRAAVQLAIQRRRAAADRAAHVGGRVLEPPSVGQFLRDG